jgi:hypothetical protein
LNVQFRFLGNTDPNSFQASHQFTVDNFFQQRTASGGTEGLGDSAFSTATFSAQADGYTINNFAFNAGAGASFTATPVPEPGSWLLMLVGLGALTRLGRRRRLG